MDVLSVHLGSRETLAEILAEEEPSRKGRGKKFASFDGKSLFFSLFLIGSEYVGFEIEGNERNRSTGSFLKRQ